MVFHLGEGRKVFPGVSDRPSGVEGGEGVGAVDEFIPVREQAQEPLGTDRRGPV